MQYRLCSYRISWFIKYISCLTLKNNIRFTHKMNKYRHFIIYVWASENLHWIIHTYCIFLRALRYRSLLHIKGQSIRLKPLPPSRFYSFQNVCNVMYMYDLHWTIRDSDYLETICFICTGRVVTMYFYYIIYLKPADKTF